MKRGNLLYEMIVGFVFFLASGSSVFAGSISGEVSYSGVQTGAIYAAVFTTPINCGPADQGEPFSVVELPALGGYTISGLPDGTYYVVSVIQTDPDDLQPADPWAIYGGCESATPVVISGNNDISGIDLDLVAGTVSAPNPFYVKYEDIDVSLGYSTSSCNLRIAVKDPNREAGSISVTGTDIPGTINFDMAADYDDYWKSWVRSVQLPSCPPPLPLEYFVTVNDSEGVVTVKKTITRYVDVFATNLSPSVGEVVYDVLMFSWEVAPGPYTYGVIVWNSYGERVWDIFGLTTTSVQYNGPPLIPGETYHNHVLVFDEEGNFTEVFESFVYGETPSTGTISGEISYSGVQTGAIYAAVFTTPINCGPSIQDEPFSVVELPALGGYTISNLPAGTYYVVSVIETVPNDDLRPADPWAIYGGCETATPVVISGGNDISGIDLALVDGTASVPNPFYTKYWINVQSGHWVSSGYYANIYVEDRDKNADSVCVSGPGITGSACLEYNLYHSGNWNLPSNPYLGYSVPSTPQTYTLTINDAEGSHVYERTITGYVEDFATNLSPTGNVEAPVVFSWTGIANASEYSVILRDSDFNRIWERYDIPPAITSITYDGLDLTSGVTYYYDIESKRRTDGENNASYTSGSFTYGSEVQPPPGAMSASMPLGASFDFSTGTVDPTGQSGDFRYESHDMIGLVAPSGISWWTGNGLASFTGWINDPNYLPSPEGWTSSSMTYNSAGVWTRWVKTAEGRYAMIFSVEETNDHFDFYYVYPYGNYTWFGQEAPLPPTLLTVTDTGTDGTLLVQWQASASPDVAGYQVGYSTSPNPGGTMVHAGNTTSHLLSGLTNGQTYYISVIAYDTEGNQSVYSQVLPGAPTVDSHSFVTNTSCEFTLLNQGTPETVNLRVVEGETGTVSFTGALNGEGTRSLIKRVKILSGSYTGWGYNIQTVNLSGYSYTIYVVFDSNTDQWWGSATGDIHAVGQGSMSTGQGTWQLISIMGVQTSGSYHVARVNTVTVPGTSTDYSDQTIYITNGISCNCTAWGYYNGSTQLNITAAIGLPFSAPFYGGGLVLGTYQTDQGGGNYHACFSNLNSVEVSLHRGSMDGSVVGSFTGWQAGLFGAGKMEHVSDECPEDPNKIVPGICGCGVADTDSDGDGVLDCNDDCPNDFEKTAPGICGCGTAETDDDGDGIPNCNDFCPNDADKIAGGVCGCGMPDTDSDGDSVADCIDGCPSDSNKIAAGVCGCGVAETDSDGDGVFDCNDDCPNDFEKTTPGICGCAIRETDDDGDGVPNCNDFCPNDADKIAAGICGCGMPDTDSDLDGIVDCNDNCPVDANPDQSDIDGDGAGDICDLDQDNDGVPDAEENAAPNSGDGNDDSTLDSDQDNVASLLSAAGDKYLTVDTITAGGGAVLADVSAIDTTQFPADPQYNLPYGLVGFTVLNPGNPGFSETVRIYFHGVADLTGYVYRKFDPNTSTWHTLPDVVFGVGAIGGQTVAYADLPLTDGGDGDSDLLANGAIVDPGGPALPVCTLTGDFDGDNDVDINDYNTFKQNWGWSGAAGSGHTADFDNDGDVDINDYNTFKQNWGRSCR